MKLTNVQARALAEKINEKINEVNKEKNTKLLKEVSNSALYKEFKQAQKDEELAEERRKKSLFKLEGKYPDINFWDEPRLYNTSSSNNIKEIQNDLLIKTINNSELNVDKFIEEMVKQYTK